VNDTIRGFWIGSDLGFLEQASIYSFLYHGYNYELYTYGGIGNIPSKVKLLDASEIYPKEKVFDTNILNIKNEFQLFSDMFRYKLLYEKGGWWADLDTICMKPLPEFKNFFLKDGDLNSILIGMIKSEKNLPVMKDAYLLCENTEPSNWYKNMYDFYDLVIKYGLEEYIYTNKNDFLGDHFDNPDNYNKTFLINKDVFCYHLRTTLIRINNIDISLENSRSFFSQIYKKYFPEGDTLKKS